MFSTSFKLRSCAVVLLLCVVGLATATFEGQSSCGIQIHRASGLVLWCESQVVFLSQNTTIYVAPMNATKDRVAIYTSQSALFGESVTATPYLETTTGMVVIVVVNASASFSNPNPASTFHILYGSIQDAKNWTVVYTQSVETETMDTVQSWVNGVFLFGTLLDNTAKNISYKALVPVSNGVSFVEVFSYSATVQSNVRSWTLDGNARLCLAVNADESSIVCRTLTNSSVDLVIHTDSNSVTFATLVSDNNGRIFWSEFNSTSLRIWAANSAKTDVPAVIDRTTNTTFVSLMAMTGSALRLGYDSYNKLVYWTENIALPLANEYTFGVFGWDGKANAAVSYFVAENISTSVGQICTFKGQMLLTATVNAGLQSSGNVTNHLYHTSASSTASASVLLFTHIFQSIGSLTLACDPQTGWAVSAFSDVVGLIGSSVSAIRIDNTTSMSIEFSSNVNITLGPGSVVLTNGIVGYTLVTPSGNPNAYDLLFYTLPMVDDVTGMPPGSDSTPNGSGNNTPTTNSNTPSKVSFANQLAPFAFFASLAYLFF